MEESKAKFSLFWPLTRCSNRLGSI
jgi:hypothetical protein